MRLALAALALLPVGLAPDPAPVMPCLGLGMDREQTKACIRREVERVVFALPPPPEQAGPPIWLCDRPECHDHMRVYITPAPSPASVKAMFERAEAARRKRALK